MQQLCAHAHGSPEIPTSAARSASSAGSSRSIASSTRARNTAWVIAFPIAATLAARSARARTQAAARDGRCGPGARNFRAGRHTARGTSSRQASIGTEIHLSVAWRGFGPPAGERVTVENIFATRARPRRPRSALLIGPYDPMGGEYTFLAPPLGVWRLCGVLRRAGHAAEVFDPNCTSGSPEDELRALLAQRQFD